MLFRSPKVGPIALYGLLFTIVFLFALQGERITDQPWDVARVALPLLVYFAIMWGASFAASYRMGLPYDRAVTVAFTSAGNNFEENFLDGAQFRKYLESRRDEFRDFLTHVGLLKK